VPARSATLLPDLAEDLAAHPLVSAPRSDITPLLVESTEIPRPLRTLGIAAAFTYTRQLGRLTRRMPSIRERPSEP
jgi:hypothetical protein